jgi:hypothetical protein
VAGVLAQSSSPDAPKPATLRFLFLDETAGAYALKLGDTYRTVSSAPYNISPPYTPASLNRIELFKTGTAPDPATGAPVRVRIAGFTPPANTTSALVIITPRPAPAGSAEPPAYGVEFIDSSPSTFPAGSLRILNRGQTTMAARFAGGQINAEPGETRIITPVADPRGRLRILVAVQDPGQWKLIDDNVAIVRPDSRLTGLLVYSPSGMKFRLGPYILAERGDPPPSHVWLTYTDTP